MKQTRHNVKVVVDTVVSDFNGTIARKDLAKLILRKFGTLGWEKYDRSFAEGKISFRECFEKQYSGLRTNSKKEVLEYIRENCDLRQGFKDFVENCSRSKISLIVASKGLDFTLKYAFEINGINPPILYCPRTKLDVKSGRWKVRFPKLTPGFHNFKESLVYSLKKKGHCVAFIGDDAYDLWAAKRSDQVFAVAKSMLAKECSVNDLDHTAFRNFTELTDLW